MYSLSVGAIFKNESCSLKEWIDHYLYHGIEHFYLINDASTDNFIDIIQPYIDKGIITLFNVSCEYFLGRQRVLYNQYILPCLHETQWMIMVDIDEYVWSKNAIDLNTIFNTLHDYGQIQIKETLFGSNGHIDQPTSVVQGFTKRSKYADSGEYTGSRKYAVNSSYHFTSLNVHHATFADKNNEINHFILLLDPHLTYNHYKWQSFHFWKNIKCTRGDGDNYITRLESDFSMFECNDIEDTELCEQNKLIVPYL